MDRLRIDHEVRGIDDKLRASEHRSSFEIITRWAARVDDLLQALVREQPDIVHISAHTTDEHEILLEGEDGSPAPVNREAFADLFRVLKDRIRIVVLNACDSHVQAAAIAEHIDCAIGMKRAIPDDAAIVFASAFYLAIFAGRSAQTAFDLGVSALKLRGMAGADVPQLIPRRGSNPTEVLVIPQALSPASPPRPPAVGGLVNVPELPPNFLPRASDLDRLKSLVLSGSAKPVGLTGRTLRAGLHGMGGIGKSVLAACLARDDQIRHQFPDGVFWITLGRDPKLALLQSELCGYLGERGVAFEHEHQGRARLSELYRDRACLVVLDDVWDARHAAAFGEMGPRGRMLITTRDAGLIVSLGAEACSLDVLAVGEALALLAAWSGQPADALPDEAREVARECGYLPLALAMIGAMVRGRRDRWSNALHKLQTANLEAIRRSFPDYAYPDLLRAIEVSLDALDPVERRRYLDFAVFAEDTPVPEAVLATLWHAEGLDTYSTQDLLDRFVDRSLLRRDEEGRLWMHDLQYDYIRRCAGDIPSLHGRLVDAYRTACPSGWPSGPRDGYFFLHLPTHLAGAGRAHELRGLLLSYAWLSAKLEATDPAALLTDYGLVPGGEAERLIEGALRLSAHVLATDKEQLAPQLIGRLLGQENGDVQALASSLSASQSRPWLRPLTASLTRPGGPLHCTLAGHSSGTRTVAVTPDGRHAISGSSDWTMRVWELETGRQVRSMAGHSRGILAVAVTPDGRHAVSGSDDGTLKVWELETGREVRTLTGHEGGVRAVAVTQDGQYAVSGSSDATVRVWELETGREVRTLKGHSSWVLAVAVTRDGRYAISGSSDTTLKLWELQTGREVRTLKGHAGGILAVAVTPDGRHAVSASYDLTLKLWELQTGREVRTLEGHTGWVLSVAVTPDGRHAVSGSYDTTIKVWELDTGREVRSLVGHSGWVFSVAVTPNGRRAVSGSYDTTIKVWELDTGPDARASSEHSDWVFALAVAPNGRYAVSGSDDKMIKVWELDTGREVRTLEGHLSAVYGVAVTPDSRYAISASDDATLRVWELDTGRVARTLEAHSCAIFSVAVTPDGRYAISASEDATLKVWELETGRVVRTLVGHSRRVRTAAVTPDGRYAVSGSYDGTLKVWELDTGRESRTLAGHSTWVLTVAVTPDSRYAVSGSEDTTLKVWELETGREVRTIRGHSGVVLGVAVTPDGQHAITGSADRTLRVWNIHTGVLVASFQSDNVIISLALGPDGRTILAGDAGGRVHFLRLEGVS